MAASKAKVADVDLGSGSESDSDATMAAEDNQDIIQEIAQIDLTEDSEDVDDYAVVATGARALGIEPPGVPDHEKIGALKDLALFIKSNSSIRTSKICVVGGILPESDRDGLSARDDLEEVFFGRYLPITAHATKSHAVKLMAHNVTVDQQIDSGKLLRKNNTRTRDGTYKSWQLSEGDVYDRGNVRSGVVVMWGMFKGANKNGMKRHILKWDLKDLEPNGKRPTSNSPVNMEKVRKAAAGKTALARRGPSSPGPRGSDAGGAAGGGTGQRSGSSKESAIEI